MKHPFLCCVVLAFLIVGIGLQALAEAPWPMDYGNSARTNQSTYSGPGTELGLAWRTGEAPIYADSSFAIAQNGTLFWLGPSQVCPQHVSVVAHDRFGGFLWEQDLGFGGSYLPGPGLAIANGVVYAGTVNTFYGFSLSGQKVMECTVPELYDTLYFLPPAIGPGGDVIIPVRRGDGLDAPVEIASIGPDGTVKWTVSLGIALWTPIAVSADGRVIAAGSELVYWPSSWLVCVGSDGEVLWTKSDLVTEETPVIDDSAGRVLMGGFWQNWQAEGALLSIELGDGSVAWSFRPLVTPREYPSTCLELDALDSDRGLYHLCWTDEGPTDKWQDDVLFVGVVDRDSNLLWSKPLANDRDKRYSYGSLVVAGDGLVYRSVSREEYRQGVYVGTTKTLSVYTPAGDILATQDITDIPDGRFAVGDDRRLYLLTQDDWDTQTTCVVYVFGAPSQEQPVYRPSILSAGYGLSRVTAQAGGILTIKAKVSHPLGTSSIESVDVWLFGVPTGLCLLPTMSDGEYSISIDVPAGFVPAGQFLLELVARDKEGHVSDVWPYLTVASE